MKNEKNRGMKSVITDGTIAEGDIRLLSYWSPSRDIVGWSSNCLLYTIVSIRIYVAFEKKYTSKFEEGKNIFCGREEKRNSNCNGRSSTVTAVTQICCTPLSPLDSTWHLRRSMCGGNNRRPTWKSQKKVQDQENIKKSREKIASALLWRENFTTPHHRHWAPDFDILLTVFFLLLWSFLNIIHEWSFWQIRQKNENKCSPFLTSFIIESQFRWIYKKSFDNTNIDVHTDHKLPGCLTLKRC